MYTSFTYLFFILFSLFSLFSFIKSTNLRKAEENPLFTSLLKGIPISYQSLQKELKSQKTTMKNILNISYFKSLESSGKITYYLNKEEKDFDSIIKDINILMGISNPNKAFVSQIFENHIPRFKTSNDLNNLNNWMNFNIISTITNDKGSIAYGSLYAIFKDGKYHFIFCYGYGKFNIEFNALNAVFLGYEGNYIYVATSVSSTYYTKDLEYFNAQYIVLFMNTVGFKVLGNYFKLELPYPNLD